MDLLGAALVLVVVAIPGIVVGVGLIVLINSASIVVRWSRRGKNES